MNHFVNVLAQVKIDASEVDIPGIAASGSLFNSIVALIYAVIAAVALFFIVRAALLFVTSGSDPGSVKDARETILYAAIALFSSTLVFFVIGFVIDRIG